MQPGALSFGLFHTTNAAFSRTTKTAITNELKKRGPLSKRLVLSSEERDVEAAEENGGEAVHLVETRGEVVRNEECQGAKAGS